MISVDIAIDLNTLARQVRIIERNIEQAIVTGVQRSLEAIELEQIHKYLSDRFPARPTGSTYRRTFRLRYSSRTRIVRRRLPVEGEWFADENLAPYAEEVLGERSQQAVIHRGRWKSLEDIVQEAEAFTPSIIDEELVRIL